MIDLIGLPKKAQNLPLGFTWGYK